MNIRDYWPISAPTVSTEAEWEKLIELRKQTFLGFLSVEEKNGFLQPKVSLSTSKGQEMIRIIAFRILEELAEAKTSVDPDHFHEEVIDAINYMISLFLLGREMHPQLAGYLHHCFDISADRRNAHSQELSHEDIGAITITLGAELGDLLRNRAWMNNAQSTYFDGDLCNLLEWIFQRVFACFPNFESFWSFFVAKDAVLQFRLRSRY